MANWRLTSITGHEPRTFSWDARGNLSASAGRTYDFDHGNRLRAVNGVESYVYDGHGRRVVATDSASGLPIISMFSQAGTLLYQWNLRLNRQIEYIHLGSRLVAQREQPVGGGTVNVKYLHTDALGTPLLETGPTGAQVQTAEYDPWGRLLNHPVTDKVGFTGHLQDGSTGLTYMQQRYYDPSIGRFLSVDPVTPYEKPITNFNRYVYALNNPYRFTDPDGRDSVGEMIDAKAMAAAGRGDNLATYGWAFAATAWNYLGAEGISQVADKGTGAGSGNGAIAVLEVATLGKGGTVLKVGGEVAEGIGKISIKGMTGHAVDQAINRGVKPASILDAVRNPLKVADAKVDALGRQSQKIVGATATVVVNPKTGKIVTVYPTSTKTAEKLREKAR